MKDLQPMCREIEEVIKKHLHLTERPGLVITLTVPPRFDDVHWISNTDRASAAKMLHAVADKMIAKNN